ncbi:aldolase [Rhodococcus artemisiae]|uniref:Aldolase n=1 Tax=Rhodococcus artemisiae TaxID=714159 RepID=A0ABU7LHL4_9NOCA|nr:aldolase [Rhodococcus artemisiae]MEE2061055.1 aldolase [Rhodococcus artemisiae]
MVGLTELENLATALDGQLADVDAAYAAAYPGDTVARQPVHTVYVAADRYDAETVSRWGAEALGTLDAHISGSSDLAAVIGIEPEIADAVLPLVRAKLRNEPIEDLRIDFEDGFVQRGVTDRDRDEDEHCARAAAALAAAPGVTPFAGIRMKSFEASTRHRGLRTLDAFIAALTEKNSLPDGFIVTLPKVTAPEQVRAMITMCEYLDRTYSLPAPLGFEIQIETPQSICGPDGTAAVATMIRAAEGRCTALHYGTYDYSAACGIAAEYQAMDHPVADHAKATMQVAAAGTGVRLSDGSTNRLPVGPEDDIRAAWGLHARLVDRSLRRGFYQGWDLHPAQLPTRFAATFAFYRRSLPVAGARVAAYLDPGKSSGYLDEPATARALASFLLRGHACGAITDADISGHAGVGLGELIALRASGAVQ